MKILAVILTYLTYNYLTYSRGNDVVASGYKQCFSTLSGLRQYEMLRVRYRAPISISIYLVQTCEKIESNLK